MWGGALSLDVAIKVERKSWIERKGNKRREDLWSPTRAVGLRRKWVTRTPLSEMAQNARQMVKKILEE